VTARIGGGVNPARFHECQREGAAAAAGTAIAVDRAGMTMPFRALLAISGTTTAAATRDVFARAGIDAVAVTSFEDAVSALNTSCPDLLAASMRLGEFNGLHLALRAHALYPDLPVLILGSADDTGTDAAGFGATFLAATGAEEMVAAAAGLLGQSPQPEKVR
jgi:PleD family two-component response regulator